MKKKPLNVKKTLSFNKETIAKLNDDQLDQIAGGGSQSCTCNNADPGEADGTINSCQACSCNGD